MFFRTLRGRLAALASAITFGVSLLVCILLYISLRFSLHREVDAFLAGEVMEFSEILRSGGTLDDMESKIRREIGARPRGDLSFRLLTLDGDVLLSSDPATRRRHLHVPNRSHEAMTFDLEPHPEKSTSLRTCNAWIHLPDGTDRVVQTTYDLADVEQSLSRFKQISIAGLLVAAAAAGVGGRIAAHRGLRPLNDMAAAARDIDLNHLEQRLKRSGAGDELDQLAERFNGMLARLEEQVGQLKQFTADAAHELRTPLAALRGSAEVMLSEKRSAEELRSGIADSIDEFDRLTHIANDLLLLARADAGQLLGQRDATRLDAAVTDVVDLFAPLAEECGIALQASIVETWVEGDSGRLRQVLTNLLDNAVKNTPAGGRIAAVLTQADGRCELSIADTGAGIDPADLPHVFDRFYRADRARRRAGGTGLGLAISKSIIQAHQGEIKIHSELGAGTTITIRLPTTAPVVKDAPQEAVTA